MAKKRKREVHEEATTTIPQIPEPSQTATAGSNEAESRSKKSDGSSMYLDGHSRTPSEETVPKSSREKTKKSLNAQSIGHASILSKFSKYRADSSDARPQPLEESKAEEQELQGLHPLPQPPQAPAVKANPNSALPKYLSNPTTAPRDSRVPFTSFGLPLQLLDRLAKLDITNAFPVQTALLPVLLSSDTGQSSTKPDALVSAPTGSGKTLSYLLPIVSNLLGRTISRTYALIIVPTHELASQVQKTAQQLASGTSLKIETAIGTRPFDVEKGHIIANVTGSTGADILIATPGRLVEHIRNNPNFTLRYLRWLVVDEADRLLSQSFQDWLEILSAELQRPFSNALRLNGVHNFDITSIGLTKAECPADVVRKVILSATMTRDVGKLAGLKLRRPQFIVVDDIGGKDISMGEDNGDPEAENPEQESKLREISSLPSTLEEHYYPISNGSQKPLSLFKLLSESKTTSGILIFVKSNEAAVRLAWLFNHLASSQKQSKKSKNGKSLLKQWNIAVSTSDKRKKEITANTNRFKSSEIDILISTDLMSRGVDLPNAQLVINYDSPRNEKDYIHRVGRTARAGNNGLAWSLVEDGEARWWWKNVGQIRRSNGMAVKRESVPTANDNEVRIYEAALERLGNEVRGV